MTTLKEIAQYLVDKDVSIIYTCHSFITLINRDIYISYHITTGDISILKGYSEYLTVRELMNLIGD